VTPGVGPLSKVSVTRFTSREFLSSGTNVQPRRPFVFGRASHPAETSEKKVGPPASRNFSAATRAVEAPGSDPSHCSFNPGVLNLPPYRAFSAAHAKRAACGGNCVRPDSREYTFGASPPVFSFDARNSPHDSGRGSASGFGRSSGAGVRHRMRSRQVSLPPGRQQDF
jgi:hypothetical protein